MATISRQQYNDLYGPTVGDKIRLGDTLSLIHISFDIQFATFPPNQFYGSYSQVVRAFGGTGSKYTFHFTGTDAGDQFGTLFMMKRKYKIEVFSLFYIL